MRTSLSRYSAIAVAMLAVASLVPLMAAERAGSKTNRRNAATSAAEEVDMFDAIDAGQIDVQFIPKDSTEANVFIKNKTKKPLNVKLPDAFAGSPVLKQVGNAGRGNMGGMGGQQMGGGMGGMGGGMGGGMMGGMGGGMGMGMFNVPAERVGKFKVPCVCLEHGKPEPRAAMTYKIEPLDEFSTDPKLYALLKLFGDGHLNQRAAQVAAWHIANNMSWEQLAAKQNERPGSTPEPYFSPDELQAGMQIANSAIALASELPPKSRRDKKSSNGSVGVPAERAKKTAPAEQSSLSTK